MRRGLKILVLAMVMAGLVAGAASAVTFINIATGSTGGAYYPLGAAMAKIWNDNIEGIKASAQSTGGTVNNIQLMGSGEAETGFMDGLYYYAYLGRDKFEGNLRNTSGPWFPLPEPTQLMIAKETASRPSMISKAKGFPSGPSQAAPRSPRANCSGSRGSTRQGHPGREPRGRRHGNRLQRQTDRRRRDGRFPRNGGCC